jgi:hypothetical protein
MKCPEKEELQRNCTAAWNEYERQVKEAQLGPTLRTASGLWVKVWSKVEVDAQSGQTTIATGLPAMRAASEWRSASEALSRHLVSHRC